MKRYIRSERIPDMTERYPEGERDLYDSRSRRGYEPSYQELMDETYYDDSKAYFQEDEEVIMPDGSTCHIIEHGYRRNDPSRSVIYYVYDDFGYTHEISQKELMKYNR